MQIIVDANSRFAKMRAHTATHLLHTHIADIFSQTKQAGSFVDEDYLRFDFHADRLLTPSEIMQIEKDINQIIYQSMQVETIETSYDEAIKLGAKAFFEDKYGDKVRLVKIKNEGSSIKKFGEIVSAELCGGTHVTNTKDIGAFAIVGQEAVASGTKRIIAITGPKVIDQIHEKELVLLELSKKLDVSVKQLPEKLEKVIKDFDDAKKTLESMEDMLIKANLNSANKKSNDKLDVILQIDGSLPFKNVVNHARTMFVSGSVLIFNQEANFALWTDKGSAKDLAMDLGLKGGGNDSLVQGRDQNVLSITA